MLLDPNAGPPRIARDGTVTQGNGRLAPSGFSASIARPSSRAVRTGGHSGSAGHAGAGFHQDRHATGLRRKCQCQRRMEMTRLINITRAFEMVSASLAASERLYRKPLRRSERPGEGHSATFASCRLACSRRPGSADRFCTGSAQGARQWHRHRGCSRLLPCFGPLAVRQAGRVHRARHRREAPARRGRSHRRERRYSQAVRHDHEGGTRHHRSPARLRNHQPASLLEGPRHQRTGRSRSTASARLRQGERAVLTDREPPPPCAGSASARR